LMRSSVKALLAICVEYEVWFQVREKTEKALFLWESLQEFIGNTHIMDTLYRKYENLLNEGTKVTDNESRIQILRKIRELILLEGIPLEPEVRFLHWLWSCWLKNLSSKSNDSKRFSKIETYKILIK
jgi:hypothetical protein